MNTFPDFYSWFLGLHCSDTEVRTEEDFIWANATISVRFLVISLYYGLYQCSPASEMASHFQGNANWMRIQNWAVVGKIIQYFYTEITRFCKNTRILQEHLTHDKYIKIPWILFFFQFLAKGAFTNYVYKRRGVGGQKYQLFVNFYTVENVNGGG